MAVALLAVRRPQSLRCRQISLKQDVTRYALRKPQTRSSTARLTSRGRCTTRLGDGAGYGDWIQQDNQLELKETQWREYCWRLATMASNMIISLSAIIDVQIIFVTYGDSCYDKFVPNSLFHVNNNMIGKWLSANVFRTLWKINRRFPNITELCRRSITRESALCRFQRKLIFCLITN